MPGINYFVEGIQGAGKTTFVQKLSEHLRDCRVFREGDFSPVELAWCAYVTEEEYKELLSRYPSLVSEIRKKTEKEGNHRIICYTQILTDIPDFHKDLERFEIYNGNLDREAFESVVLSRFRKWDGEGQIFECSIFQNIIENQMLYLRMTGDEILDFYRRLKDVLADKIYRIIYLDVQDVSAEIDVIRKERCDDQENELWFPMMVRYVEESPYGKEHALKGLEGLLMHLEQRRELEHRILDHVFRKNAIVVKAKSMEPLWNARTTVMDHIDFRSGVLQDFTENMLTKGLFIDVSWKRGLHFQFYHRWGRFWYAVVRDGEQISSCHTSHARQLDGRLFPLVQKFVDEIENGNFDNKKTPKEKVRVIVRERGLTSHMNDTKWKEFLYAMTEEMPLAVPYDYKTLFEEDREESYFGTAYDRESFNYYYFRSIEWVKLQPKFSEHIHRGRLVEDEIIDHDVENEFLALMDKYHIPYEYDSDEKVYVIYGYK